MEITKGAVVRYLIRFGDATSQWINVVFLFANNPNESISGRAYRQRNARAWHYTQKALDLIFWVFEKEHCRLSYEADLDRARETLEKAN
tara:strand:+ start:18003 stop:18269 length:267 start_codon:yes stop_codon:yes gene_type:complete